MNSQRKPLIIGIAAAVVAALILGVVLFGGGEQPAETATADPSGQVEPPAVEPGGQDAAATVPDQDTNIPAPVTADLDPAAEVSAEVSDQEAAAAPPQQGQEDSIMGTDQFLDDETIMEQLAQYGSYQALYDAASPSQREDIIDYLVAEEMLRDEIVNLLPSETDPDLRTYMLLRTDPEGFYDPDTPDDFFDDELEDLLEQQPATPITEEEWMARMDLAYLMDDSYGMQWVRDGRQAFPNSPDVNLLASTLTLNINASTGEPNFQEVPQSTDFIMSTLDGANAQSFSPDQRMRAYWALFWAPDQQASLGWLQGQQQYETNPQASDTLERIIEHLESSSTASAP